MMRLTAWMTKLTWFCSSAHDIAHVQAAQQGMAYLELVSNHVAQALVVHRANEDICSKFLSRHPADHCLPCRNGRLRMFSASQLTATCFTLAFLSQGQSHI